MNELELLEAAAKAAGVKIIRSRLLDPMHKDMLAANSVRNFHHENGPWNPLADDGDALRLAATLRLDVSWWRSAVTVETDDKKASSGICVFTDDPAGVMRFAIVRAAAELGKAS